MIIIKATKLYLHLLFGIDIIVLHKYGLHIIYDAFAQFLTHSCHVMIMLTGTLLLTFLFFSFQWLMFASQCFVTVSITVYCLS